MLITLVGNFLLPGLSIYKTEKYNYEEKISYWQKDSLLYNFYRINFIIDDIKINKIIIKFVNTHRNSEYI